jgi:hypothetical protein
VVKKRADAKPKGKGTKAKATPSKGAAMTVAQLRKEHARYIKEFKAEVPDDDELLDFDLNLHHRLAIGEGSSLCNFGMMWLLSMNGTGHEHIVLLPVCGRPPLEWPVAFYEEEEGTAEVFATSITRWFPAYIVYVAASEYRQPKLGAYASRLVDHCKKHFDFDAKKLVEGRASNKLSTAEAYGLVEPGSYVHRFHELLEKDAPAADFAKLARDSPFYNAPLRQLYEMDKLDDALAWEALHRNLRWDFRSDETFVEDLVQDIGRRLAGKDKKSPLQPMFARIKAGEDYWKGA